MLRYIIKQLRVEKKGILEISVIRLSNHEVYTGYDLEGEPFSQTIAYLHCDALCFENKNATFRIKKEYIDLYENAFTYPPDTYPPEEYPQFSGMYFVDFILVPSESHEVIWGVKKWSEKAIYQKILELSKLPEIQL